MQVLKSLGLLFLAAVLAVIGLIIFRVAPKVTPAPPVPAITNFEECAAAGNPIMESYPEQCRTPDGRLFVRDVPPIVMPEEEIVFNGCAVAGCSSQLCVSAEEASNIMTTCEFRAEYACYKEASCEPQADGKCGWTKTPALTQCLANPPAMDAQLEVM